MVWNEEAKIGIYSLCRDNRWHKKTKRPISFRSGMGLFCMEQKTIYSFTNLLISTVLSVVRRII